MESSTLYLEVLTNFEQLFKTKDNYDVIIHAGEEPTQAIYAHSVVLCCQSNYFRAALSKNWEEKKDGKYIFKKPNIHPHNFKIILRYLYCGQIDLSVEDGLDVSKLLLAAEEFGLITLAEYIQIFIINNTKELLQIDPVGILVILFRYETFLELKAHGLETICQEPTLIFETDKVTELPAHILESLLLLECLELNEIKVWNNLIKWTHAQHPAICNDVSQLKKEDFILMKETISRFIPLIRFHDITGKEYFEEVLPYKSLLPKKLKHEIMQFYLVSDIKQIGSLPSRFCNFDSVIVNARHLALFASWINRKVEIYSIQKNPYEFNLILRGSKDGFDATSFHTKCDNKDATIVIAKIKDTNQMVGGYNPLDWIGNNSKATTDSYIFLFENYKDLDTGKIGRIMKTKDAIRCFDNNGPLFGSYLNGSNDIMVTKNGKWSSKSNSYQNLNIPRNFEIDDYEVFQIVLK